MISSWLLWGSIESYGSRGGEWERQDTLRGENALNQQILVLFFRNWSTVISIMVWTYRVGITIWIHPVLLHHLVSRPHSTHRQVGCHVHSRYYILYPLCWIYSTHEHHLIDRTYQLSGWLLRPFSILYYTIPLCWIYSTHEHHQNDRTWQTSGWLSRPFSILYTLCWILGPWTPPHRSTCHKHPRETIGLGAINP